MTTDEEQVLVERRGHVMVITMNRPEARNAINENICIRVGDALEEAELDSDVRVVVLTGTGPSFSAGADLKAIMRGERIIPEGAEREKWHFAGWVRHYTRKPTIAAVNGTALGGGTEIALASDLIVAAESATFGLPEAKRGLVAGAGGAFRIMQQLPYRLALELLLTGDAISAHRAYEMGLVNRVVPDADLLEATLELAEKIAANAPLAVQAHKRIALEFEGDERPGEDQHWERTSRESAPVGASEDAKEGPRAFAEKRAPVWQAR